MLKPLVGKSITVIGSSGYVGSNIMRQAIEYGAYVNGISRRGTPNKQNQWQKEINWIKGDAMNPETFKDVLTKSDVVINTIGTLIDTSITKKSSPGEPGTYEQMNRDACIRLAECLRGTKTKFVYISASSTPPFIPRYLSTKQEAEQHLLKMHQENAIQPVILRAGFIYSWEQRWWSVPLMVDLTMWKCVHDKLSYVIPKQSSIGQLLNQFKVDSCVELQNVVDSSLACLKMDLIGKCLNNDEIAKVASDFRRMK